MLKANASQNLSSQQIVQVELVNVWLRKICLKQLGKETMPK